MVLLLPQKSQDNLGLQKDVRETTANITSKTAYITWPGLMFQAVNPDTDQVTNNPSDGILVINADGITVLAPVNLPDGSIITGAVVYGIAAGETWSLRRQVVNGDDLITMGSGNIGTEDTSISDSTIDNSNYFYFFITSSLDTNDDIRSARIKYTTI